jgi:hypothetical protein
VPSVPNCTSASPERSGYESTSLQDMGNGLGIQLLKRVAGEVDTLAAEAGGRLKRK